MSSQSLSTSTKSLFPNKAKFWGFGWTWILGDTVQPIEMFVCECVRVRRMNWWGGRNQCVCKCESACEYVTESGCKCESFFLSKTGYLSGYRFEYEVAVWMCVSSWVYLFMSNYEWLCVNLSVTMRMSVCDCGRVWLCESWCVCVTEHRHLHVSEGGAPGSLESRKAGPWQVGLCQERVETRGDHEQRPGSQEKQRGSVASNWINLTKTSLVLFY